MTDLIHPDEVTVVDTDGECSRAWDTADGMRCAGEVEERTSRSGLTRSMICAAHRQELEDSLDRIARDYGVDSDTPPSWFDPTIAGESWDGE